MIIKEITIRCYYPRKIYARDNENQRIEITRPIARWDDPSDADECRILSLLTGDIKVKEGKIPWGKAFAAIQDMMNCSTLDNGFNS